jgi:hypothetical protein
VDPFKEAVMVEAWSVVTVPALTLNVAEVDPEETVTVVGIVRTDGALPESATTLALVADWESVTVQVVLVLEVKLWAVHCREDRVGRVTGGTAELLTVTSSMMSSVALYPP